MEMKDRLSRFRSVILDQIKSGTAKCLLHRRPDFSCQRKDPGRHLLVQFADVLKMFLWKDQGMP